MEVKAHDQILENILVFKTQLMNYQISEEVLGKGAFGKVVIAKNEHQKIVAAKIMTIKVDDQSGQEYRNEIKNLLKVLNPYVIRPINCMQSKRNFYIFLEYANRGTLRGYLKSFYKKSRLSSQTTPFLPESHVQYIIKQLVTGLAHIHSQHIIHRDLKLDNVFLHDATESNFAADFHKIKKNAEDFEINNNIVVKIGDLGLSKLIEKTVSTAMTICGSPNNMAPEVFFPQLRKNKSYTYSADIWSLGTIVYEMAFGVPPFIGKTIEEIKTKIKNGAYAFPQKTISRQMLTFINGLLQYEPEQRFEMDEINNHPFIKDHVDSFSYLDLGSAERDQRIMDSKNGKNWISQLYEELLEERKIQESPIPEKPVDGPIIAISNQCGDVSPIKDNILTKIDEDLFEKKMALFSIVETPELIDLAKEEDDIEPRVIRPNIEFSIQTDYLLD